MPQAIPLIFTAAAAAASAATTGVLGLSILSIGSFSITVGTLVGGVLSIAASLAGSILNRPPDAEKQSIGAVTPRIRPKPEKRLALGRYKFGARDLAIFTSDRDLYAASFIASHRIAIGHWTLYIDDSPVETWEGDPFDMAGDGAKITAPKVLDKTRFWISDGTHARGPKRFVDDQVTVATDRWQGLAMVWVLSEGVEAKDFNLKYPKAAHREVQIECDGGLWIHPITQRETYTATPALIAYGLMRHELGFSYDAIEISGQTFADAAVIESAPRLRADGDTSPLFEMNGPLDLSSDRGDFITKVESAAASMIVLQGGRWAYIPGVARQSVMTLTLDHIAGPPKLGLVGSPDQRFNAVEGTFIDPTLYTTGTNPLYRDEVALIRDGVERLMQPQYEHVTDYVQAQHLDRIGQRVSQHQRTWSSLFAGRASFLTKGDVVTTAFDMPFWIDGAVIVLSAKTEIVEVDDVPHEVTTLSLREYDPSDYGFGAADQLPYSPPPIPSRSVDQYAAPATISVSFSGSGSARTAELAVPRIDGPTSIEWAYSTNGNNWTNLPDATALDRDPIILRQERLPVGSQVQWRGRYAGGTGLTGDYRETTLYQVPGSRPIPSPFGGAGAVTVNSATTTWSLPGNAQIDRLEIYRSSDQSEPDPLQGSRVELRPTAPGANETYTDNGLAAGSYRYWGRCYGGSQSGDWSAPVDASTGTPA